MRSFGSRSVVAPLGNAVRYSCSPIRHNSDVGRNLAELWRVQLRFRVRFFVIQNASQRCPLGQDATKSLVASGAFTVWYLDYDWSLNQQ